MATASSAANAYASLARLTDPGAGVAKAAGDTASAQSFGAMLKDAMGAVAQTGRNADSQTQAVAAGKTNVVDVVTAVAESETAIEALVSVRDKVIQAYDEIMKMPI
jgi:flagellar hook-basal body complex protein FliE